jgi:ELWxxDGT repeat protein
VSGIELWKSDGTEKGTVRVADINPGVGSSYPSRLTAIGSTLYFTANDGVSGNRLWKSDVTKQGDFRVSEINPFGFSQPENLTAVGSTLYFTATDAVNGYELWSLAAKRGGGGEDSPKTSPGAATPPYARLPYDDKDDSSDESEINDEEKPNRLEPTEQGRWRLEGGGDADGFIQSVNEPRTLENADLIIDFNRDERDFFEMYRDAFPGLTRIRFKSVTSNKKFKKEQSKKTNIIYNERTGELWFDANGKSKSLGDEGGIFAILENKAPLTGGDFRLV